MDKLQQVDWRGLVKSATTKVKKYTLNLTDLELKVEDATNAETWGPHGSTMNEIADAAFDPENYRQIMGVLARRLQERDENWRMCYKALLLLEHLIKHGPGKIVGDVQSSAAVLERLENFQYKDANLKDHGVNVRHRAKEILQLVNDPLRLREEREKAKANRQKYRGVSADQMRSTNSFGGGSSSYTGFGGSSTSFGGGGAGALGGSSRRTNSYDSTDEDAHYISKRGDGAGSSGRGGTAGGTAGGEDPVAATRARIEKMKLSGGQAGAAAAEEKLVVDGASKKKLTDVRVNPNIAASLGLKAAVAPSAPAAAAAPARAAPAAGTAPVVRPAAADLDLLGGLDDPSPAPAPAAAVPVAAPAAVAFDPFATAAPAAAASGSWDAFAAAGPGSSSSPAKPAAAPVQPADPFAALAPGPSFTSATSSSAPSPLAALSMGGSSFKSAPQHAAAAAPPLPSVAAGVPAALPEDMFSDLTGIGRPQPPMGHPPQPSAGGPGMGGSWGAPTAAAAVQPAPAAPFAAFGDFSSSGGGNNGMGMGMGMAPSGGMQPCPSGPAAAASASHSSSDFGSFSYSSAPAGGSSTAADPFADLLK